MTHKVRVSDLDAVHEALADALYALERMGEFTAVAHLAAALDSIEASIEMLGPGGGVRTRADGRAPGETAISRIARQMKEAFGEKAEAVARGQLACAVGASLTAWAAIVNDIAA